MSLRGNPISEPATLPDGRAVRIELRVLDDDYVEERQDTVTLELVADGGEVLAALNTVFDPEDSSEARQLAHRIREGLESGELEPTAGAIEPLADSALERG